MEDSFERLGFFSLILRVWDLAFGPDGAFGMDIHVLEAWTPNLVMEQNLILKVRLFLSGSKSLGLGIWPRRSIWEGHQCARGLDTI